jgi:hypothetical protein
LGFASYFFGGFGCFFGCFFDGGAFGCAFSDNTEFSDWHVCSACEGVVAFSAFPNAHAFALDFDESAVWAAVLFFQTCDDFVVAFSDGRPVAGTEPSCWAHFLCSGQVFHQSSFLRSSAAFSLAIFEASVICCGVK